MTHYNNVTTLMESMKTLDLEKIIDLFEPFIGDVDKTYYDDAEQLAQDIMYVMISLWGGTTPQFRANFELRITEEAINQELKLMFPDDEDECFYTEDWGSE